MDIQTALTKEHCLVGSMAAPTGVLKVPLMGDRSGSQSGDSTEHKMALRTETYSDNVMEQSMDGPTAELTENSMASTKVFQLENPKDMLMVLRTDGQMENQRVPTTDAYSDDLMDASMESLRVLTTDAYSDDQMDALMDAPTGVSTVVPMAGRRGV